MCKRLIKGTGSVGGSLRALDDGNVRFVEERPWRVKGRSRSRAASVGPDASCCSGGDVASADGSLLASRVRRSLRFSVLSAGIDFRISVGEPSLTGICGSPCREKASLKAGLPSTRVLGGRGLLGVIGAPDGAR